MEKITIVFFKWSRPGYRSVFTGEHVNIARDMIRRNTTIPVEFVCVTDDPRGIDHEIRIVKLWDNPAPGYGRENRPNCFYRIKAFSREMSEIIGKRFLWVDLDAVIRGNIDHILNDPADFKIWRVDDAEMPCNGSLVLHRAGTRQEFWNNFDPSKVDPVHGLKKINGFMGSDQSWIASQMGPEDKVFGRKDGVYSFRIHLKAGRISPPEDAKIIFFHGRHNPWDEGLKNRCRWIARHYRRDNDPIIENMTGFNKEQGHGNRRIAAR